MASLHLFLPEQHKWARDERCRCSHARSDHDDHWTTYNGEAVNVPGKGRCCEAGCSCQRFRFAAWVYHEDAQLAVC